MMVKPSKEYLRLSKLVEPWIGIDMEKYEPVLRQDAPEEVKKAYKKISNPHFH